MTPMEFRCSQTAASSIAVAVGVSLALSACSQQDNTIAADTRDESTGEPVTSISSIYVERTFEKLVEQGANAELSLYQESLSFCEQAQLSTQPLTPDEEARLGTQRWKFWWAPGQLAYRSESWKLVIGDTPATTCHFSLQADTALHSYFDTEKTVHLDMLTGRRNLAAPQPDKLRVVSASLNEQSLSLIRDGTSQLNDARNQRITWEGPEQQSVLGQPCSIWRQNRTGETVCVWSGGLQWGFSNGPINISQEHVDSSHGLVLRADPPQDGYGARLTTTTFSVNLTFDPDEILPGSLMPTPTN